MAVPRPIVGPMSYRFFEDAPLITAEPLHFSSLFSGIKDFSYRMQLNGGDLDATDSITIQYQFGTNGPWVDSGIAALTGSAEYDVSDSFFGDRNAPRPSNIRLVVGAQNLTTLDVHLAMRSIPGSKVAGGGSP